MNKEKEEKIKKLMVAYQVKKLETGSQDHARHALEQALLDGKIGRGEYEVLLGYVIYKMFK